MRSTSLWNWIRSPTAAQARPPEGFLSRWIFLRLLGLVYLAAFVSLWVQIDGLIGSRGILPVGDFLTAVERQTGPNRFHEAPTLCWLDPGDRLLHGLCAAGTLAATLLILGVAPVPSLLGLWVCYLSLSVAGQIFLAYQWDVLLLEAGFLAIFFAPLQFWPRLARETAPSRTVRWLLYWLLFRLVFLSGVVKLGSGDEAWRNLTAMNFHYETQPLPTWTSWYMHQLPESFHGTSVLGTFVLELLVPLLIFGPRFCRQVACAGIVGLQVLIAATGNYGFFNLLTIALAVLLLDDAVFPQRWRARLTATRPRRHGSRWLVVPLAAGVLVITSMEFLHRCGISPRWPALLQRAHAAVMPFRSLNSYGLFAVMTTQRPEIVIEGSDDGQTWLPYAFKWKPGDLKRRPMFTGLHMPRLDWQMWFAALGSYEANPWFMAFLRQLLHNRPEVVALLAHNPFPEAPPRLLRAVVYRYRFTDAATGAETGAWWRRELLGLYCPVVRLREAAD